MEEYTLEIEVEMFIEKNTFGSNYVKVCASSIKWRGYNCHILGSAVVVALGHCLQKIYDVPWSTDVT